MLDERVASAASATAITYDMRPAKTGPYRTATPTAARSTTAAPAP